MKRTLARPAVWGWALVFALWGAAFSLACRVAPGVYDGANPVDSPAARLAGGSRALLGGHLVGQADRTFHGGVAPYRVKAFSGVFDRLSRAITPEAHVHLRGADATEIVPWLYLATRADPRNVEAYVLAAYWLAGQGGRPDLAERVLAEARRVNPGEYRVYREQGRLAMKTGRLADAGRAFETGLRAWARRPGPDAEQAQIDRSEMLTYLGLLAEARGDTGRAMACYREVLEAFPGRARIRERLVHLERDGRAEPPPSALWNAILYPAEHACGRDHGPDQDTPAAPAHDG